MAEALHQPLVEGQEVYMELGGEDTPLTTIFLYIVRDLWKELANIAVGHERFLK